MIRIQVFFWLQFIFLIFTKFEYKIENERRKHNYIPFILELLKLTAKKGKLEGLIEEAKQKKKEKNEKNHEKTQQK